MANSAMVVVITGSSSGIGKEIGNYLHQKGHSVYGLSRSIPEDVDFKTITTDMTDLVSVQKAVESILSQENSIDVWVNNAGKGMVGAVEDATKEEIQSLLELNLIGVVNGIKAVMPVFREQGQGKIINISSIGSVMGLPFRGFYSASKSALDMMTEALRYEISEFGVQATSVHLGDIKTNIAQNRIGSEVSPAYEKNFQKVYEGMNAHVEEGIGPETVAQFIDKLIGKQKLKAHYYFGKPTQKLSVLLKKILPQAIFENLIKSYSGLK